MTDMDYRSTVYPSGRRVIVHRSGLSAVMDDVTGEFIHGVRPIYDGWMTGLYWMDVDDTTDTETIRTRRTS